MIDNWETVLIVVGLTAAAINGGAFFAFSNFVMPALAKLPTGTAASAMQAINRAAPNPAFVATIVGAGLIGVPVAVAETDRLGDASTQYVLGGAALSLASLAITITFNVPRNNALEGLDPNAVETEAYWVGYLASWTRGNTVRTLTSLASAVSYALALMGR